MQALYSVKQFCSNLAYGYVKKRTNDQQYTPVYKDFYGQWKMIIPVAEKNLEICPINDVDEQVEMINLKSFFELFTHDYIQNEYSLPQYFKEGPKIIHKKYGTYHKVDDDERTKKQKELRIQEEEESQRKLNEQKYTDLEDYKNKKEEIENEYSEKNMGNCTLSNDIAEALKLRTKDGFYHEDFRKDPFPFNGFAVNKKYDSVSVRRVPKINPFHIKHWLNDVEDSLITHYLKPKTTYKVRQWINFERKVALGVATLTSMVFLVYKYINRKVDERE